MTILTVPIPQGPIATTDEHGNIICSREWYKYFSLIQKALGSSTTYVEDTASANALAQGRVNGLGQRISQVEMLLAAAIGKRNGVNFASTTEQLTGTANNKASTPDSVAALWEQGSNIASAATISIGEGGYFHVTGTTNITDIDFATDKAGRIAWLVFDGILTLVHNASTLILPGSASIQTKAGDGALVVSEGSDVVRVLFFYRKSATVPTGTGIYAPLVTGASPLELIENPSGECIMVEIP